MIFSVLASTSASVALASYGNMSLRLPPLFYLCAAAVVALPGAILILGLQLAFGGKPAPRGSGFLVASATAWLIYNASTAHAAVDPNLLRLSIPLVLPIGGTLMVLWLQAAPSQERVAAWILATSGTTALYLRLPPGVNAQNPFQTESILLGGLAVSMGAWHWGQHLALHRRPLLYSSRSSWGRASVVIVATRSLIHLWEKVGKWPWSRAPTVACLRPIAASVLLLVSICIAFLPLDIVASAAASISSHVEPLLRRWTHTIGADVVRGLGSGICLGAAWLLWRFGSPTGVSGLQNPPPYLRRGIANTLVGLAYAAILSTDWGRFDKGAHPVDHVLLNVLALGAAAVTLDAYRHEQAQAVRSVHVLLASPLAAYASLNAIRMLLEVAGLL
jgi:hypothetical protein